MIASGKVQAWLGMGMAMAALVAVRVPVTQAQAQPIPVTGWNQDTILDIDSTARFGISVDNGNCLFFENTAVDDTGVERDNGLPAGMTFDSFTGNATYFIQPANGNNTLQVLRRETQTLTLVTPGPYSQLFVIATGGNASATEVLNGFVTYADGSTQAFTYNCFDWCGNHAEAAIAGLGRACTVGVAGTAFNYNFCNSPGGAALYETEIDADNTKSVVSVTFAGTQTATWSGKEIAIYAISGQ